MIELVIARYKEDPMQLAWMNTLRPDIKITIYNKGGLEVPGEIPLPNVGLEDHTFLHHIIDRYDSLAEWTFFAQANPFDGCQNAVEVINHFPSSAIWACLTPATGIYFWASCEPHRVEGLCYGHVWDRAVWEICSPVRRRRSCTFRLTRSSSPPARRYLRAARLSTRSVRKSCWPARSCRGPPSTGIAIPARPSRRDRGNGSGSGTSCGSRSTRSLRSTERGVKIGA